MESGKYKGSFESHGYKIGYEANVRADSYTEPDTMYLSNGDPGYPGYTEYYNEEMVDYEIEELSRNGEDVYDEEFEKLNWLDDEIRKHCEDQAECWVYD